MPNAPFVAIIDCGVGNHTSVLNAFAHLHVRTELTSDPAVIAEATHLVFPGVGSFAAGMAGVHARNLAPVLTEEVQHKRKPILGICLGMQLFASEGHEHGVHEGLGWIPGTVRTINTTLRLPHIGWNNVRITGTHPIVAGFESEPMFYYVHSYHLVPEDKGVIAGISDYGTEVTAVIAKDNIMGAQFHPEKSHEDGLHLFRNFLTL